MDTNTINHIISKVDERFTSLLPHVKNITQEYVNFVVYKIGLQFSIIFLLLVISTSLTFLMINKIKENNIFVGLSFLFGLLSLGLFVMSLETGYNFSLALNNPLMYTIHTFIR